MRNEAMHSSAMNFPTARLLPFPTHAPPDQAGGRLDSLCKAFAAAIVLAAIVTPTCCLDGSHAHGALTGFGPICHSRAAPL
jgi:hypothetical protein